MSETPIDECETTSWPTAKWRTCSWDGGQGLWLGSGRPLDLPWGYPLDLASFLVSLRSNLAAAAMKETQLKGWHLLAEAASDATAVAIDTHGWSGSNRLLRPLGLRSVRTSEASRLLRNAVLRGLTAEEATREGALASVPSVLARALEYAGQHPVCPPLALAFAAMVRAVRAVEYVVCEDEGDELTIWTIVNEATRADRYAVYDCQWNVMQVVHNLAVGFNLIERDGRPIEELVEWGEGAVIIEV